MKSKREQQFLGQRLFLSLLAVFGMSATALPWLARTLNLTEAGVHSDLWYSLVVFLVAMAVCGSGCPKRNLTTRRRWIVAVCAVLAIVIGALNLPTIWSSRQQHLSEKHPVDDLLASYGLRHVLCYVAVVATGITILFVTMLTRTGNDGTDLEPQ